MARSSFVAEKLAAKREALQSVLLQTEEDSLMSMKKGSRRSGQHQWRPLDDSQAQALDATNPFCKGGRRWNETRPRSPKSFSIEEEVPICFEEEVLRNQRLREQAQEAKDREVQEERDRADQDERRQAEELQDELRRRPHAFDSSGNVIWVEEFNASHLPGMQEVIGYNVSAEVASPSGDQAPQGANKEQGESKPATIGEQNRQASRRKRPGRVAQPNQARSGFSDGFTKFDHGQPATFEAMALQPGVAAQSAGVTRSVALPDTGNRQMSRKEYLLLAERQEAARCSPHESRRQNVRPPCPLPPSPGDEFLPVSSPPAVSCEQQQQSVPTPSPTCSPSPAQHRSSSSTPTCGTQTPLRRTQRDGAGGVSRWKCPVGPFGSGRGSQTPQSLHARSVVHAAPQRCLSSPGLHSSSQGAAALAETTGSSRIVSENSAAYRNVRNMFLQLENASYTA